MLRPIILQPSTINLCPQNAKGMQEGGYLIRAIATIINPTDFNFGLFARFAGSG